MTDDIMMSINVDARLKANEHLIGDYMVGAANGADMTYLRYMDGYRRPLILEYALGQAANACDEQVRDACKQYNILIYGTDTWFRSQLVLPQQVHQELVMFADRLIKIAVVKNNREGRNVRMAAWVVPEVAARLIEAEKVTP